jgi:hypothetical protein
LWYFALKKQKVIIINPIVEIGLVKFDSPTFPIKSLVPGSDIANLYLQPLPGSDVALFHPKIYYLLNNIFLDAYK